MCQQSQAPQPSHEPLQEGAAASSRAVKRYPSRRDGVQARPTDQPGSPFFPSQLQLQLYVFPLEQYRSGSLSSLCKLSKLLTVGTAH